MAGNKIVITTALNLDDSQFKSGISGVETILKKLSTANTFIKLKLDDKDFRAEYQNAIKDAMSGIRKAYGARKGEEITYRNAKGNSTKIDTIGSMKTAYNYALGQSANDKISASDRAMWQKRADSLAIYLNILKQIGQETKNIARSEKEIREMPFREERARRSAAVAAEKRRAYNEMLAPEKAEKQADRLFRNEALEKMKQAEKARIEAARQAEKEEREIEKRKTANLRKQAQDRERIRRQEEQSYKRSIASRKAADAESNRIASGGNSNSELARMRAYYNEQARLANQQSVQARRAVVDQERLNMAFERQSRLFSGLTRLAMRYFSIFTVINVGRKMIETTGYFEQQRVALEGIFHSAEKARDAIEELKQMALNSPFQTKELVGGAKQLSAYGIDKDELLETTKMIGDLSAGLGVSMDRLILAYGQVKAATVLRGQELRQFTEAGVPILDKLAEKLTEVEGKLITTKDVFEYISKRKVSFEMVSSVLKDMTSEGGKFYNMQEKLTDTLYGQVQKLKDVWTLELNDVGSGMGNSLRKLIEFTQVLIKNFRTVATTIAGIITGNALGRWLVGLNNIANQSKLIERLQGRVLFLQRQRATQEEINAAKTAVTVAKYRELKVAAGAALGSFAMSMGITAVIAGLSILIGKWLDAKAAAEEYRRKLDEIESSHNKDAMAQKDGLDNLLNTLHTTAVGTKEYEEALSSLKSNYNEYINPKYIDFLLAEKEGVVELAGEWQKLADNIKEAIDAKNEISKHREKAQTSGETILQEIKENAYNGITHGSHDPFGMYKYNDRKVINFGSEQILSVSNRGNSKDLYEQFDTQDAYNIIINSFEEFFNNLGTTQEDFNNILSDRLKKDSNIPEEIKNQILSKSEVLYKLFEEDSGKFNDYLEEAKKALVKTDSEIRQEKFRNAYEEGMTVSKEDYSQYKLVEGEEDKYNPFFQRDRVIQSTSKVIQNELDDLDKKVNADIEHMVVGGENGSAEYVRNMDTVKDALDKINKGNWDWNTLYDLSNGLSELGTTLAEGDLLQQIWDLINGLQNIGAYTPSSLDAQINAYIDDLIKKYPERKLQYDRWRPEKVGGFYSGTDKVAKEIKAVNDKITLYLNKHPGAKTKELELQKENLELLKSLWNPMAYYRIEESKSKKPKPKKSPKPHIESEQVSAELSEFWNKLKDAYQLYKTSTQQLGMEYGVGEVKANKQITEMFGEFFNGIVGEQFKKLTTIKVGKNGKQTLFGVLQDAFIKGGLENGVMDFEKAAHAVSESLKKYYKGDTKHRKDYLRLAKSIDRWIYDTISKDNINIKLKELEKALGDVTLKFDTMNKNIDAYNKLAEQGTRKRFGYQLGLTDEDALTLKSERTRSQIAAIIDAYNTAKAGETNGMFPDYVLDNFKTIADIDKKLSEIQKLEDMNPDNFAATRPGEILLKNLKPVLTALKDSMIDEFTSISLRTYTGQSVYDATRNAGLTVNGKTFETLRKNVVAMRAGGIMDQNAIEEWIKAMRDESGNVLNAFMEENFIKSDTLIDVNKSLDDLDELLMRFDNAIVEATNSLDDANDRAPFLIEFLKRARELRDELYKLKQFAKPGSMFYENAQRFTNAKKYAQGEYDRVTREKSRAEVSLKELYFDKLGANTERFMQLREWMRAGKQFTPEQEAMYKGYIDLLSDEDIKKIQEYEAAIASANEQLQEMGTEGKNLFKEEQLKAVENMKSAMEGYQEELDKIDASITSSLSAFKSLADMVGKFYDILNDGENPEWLQEMSGVIGDIIDNFQAMLAPIKAVFAAIIALTVVITVLGTTTGIALGAIAAAALLVAAIIAAFQSNDRSLERQIENLKKDVEGLERMMTNLNAVAERGSGWEKFGQRLEAVGKESEKAVKYAQMAEKEMQKKNTDTDKYDEYLQQATEANNNFLNSLKSMRDELTGSFESWADSMSSAIRSAFQNGENAARNFRDAMYKMMGDIVEKMLKMSILEPLLQNALDNLLGGSVEDIKKKYTNEKGEFDSEGYRKYMMERLNDETAMKRFAQNASAAGDATIEAVDSMSNYMKFLYGYNGSTSALSGGIKGITEDTARTLEGLSNSILQQNVLQTNYLQALSQSGFAQVQKSWFEGMIQLQTKIEDNTRRVNVAIEDMRNNTRPLYVKMQ